MARVRPLIVARSPEGPVIPNARVYIYERDPGYDHENDPPSAHAQVPIELFASEAGGGALLQPLLTNELGIAETFWMKSGSYDRRIVGGDVDYIVPDEALSAQDMGRVVAAGNLGAAYQLDVREGRNVLLTGTLNANCALTFANLRAGSSITLVLTQDATGNRTLSVAGSTVAVNKTPASVTVIRVHSPDGSTVYIDAPGVDPSVVGASVRRTTAQSIANGATPAIIFNEEVWDSHGFVNLGTSATRITIPAGLGGLYAISAKWGWEVNNAGVRFGGIFRNATLGMLASDRRTAAAESGASLYVEEPLAAGDFLELILHQTSGGALNTTLAAAFEAMPQLTVCRLGPTP
jgi:hypothetical protein